ncbi:MAG: FAD-dependent oxidoreductase [Vicinamibacterales bacterium]
MKAGDRQARATAYLTAAEATARLVPGLEGVRPRPIDRVAVIGGGTMGVGIAVACAEAGLPVTVIDRAESVAGARERVQAVYTRHVKRQQLSPEALAERLARVAVSEAWDAVGTAPLVVEAAFEDMAVKADIFRRLDALAPAGAVLATNTSYLDVDAIAAVTGRPQDVLGLHFFAPANIMKLLEIVRAASTAPEVVATGLALATRLKKQPVVAGVCDGFIGNRIFAMYRRHAEYLLEDGASPEEIDAAVEGLGFAMGPFAVSDLSGLDIAFAMRRRRDATRDPGERYVAIADRLVEAGRLGRKAGAGWYAYDASGARTPDPATAAVIASERARKGLQPRTFTAADIQRRLLAVMANEGAKALAEGIALRASDIDVALVNGYAFPRAMGGPMWAADERGLATVVAEVEQAHQAGGVGSEPAPLLVDLARTGGRLTEWTRA